MNIEILKIEIITARVIYYTKEFPTSKRYLITYHLTFYLLSVQQIPSILLN